MQTTNRIKIAIVPHTHWDREWYEPFQLFQIRLVEMVDSLLDLLENDQQYSFFLLDGQLAMIDDYLEIRPQNEDRIRNLALEKRLGIGPWYTLADEFLVSGEALIRNLQMGLERATQLLNPSGNQPDYQHIPMHIGYLPDCFGHIAQMPQLLVSAGIDKAVVWRGVPSSIKSTSFLWESPDGSKVYTEYLPNGYSNGKDLPNDTDTFCKWLDEYIKQLSETLLNPKSSVVGGVSAFITSNPTPITPILIMNGDDHAFPQVHLSKLISQVNTSQNHYEPYITSLEDYLGKKETLQNIKEQIHTGELRSAARANMLSGVASNRSDIKQISADVEKTLERIAEPLCALYIPDISQTQPFLKKAWREVVLNSAHDSICTCSVEEVANDVISRFTHAKQIATSLIDKALDKLGGNMNQQGTVVINSSWRTRSGVVELILDTDTLPPGTQALGITSTGPTLSAEVAEFNVDINTLQNIMGQLKKRNFTQDAWINRIILTQNPDQYIITVQIEPVLRGNLDLEKVKEKVLNDLKKSPEKQIKVLLKRSAVMKVLALVNDVPGFGWKMFHHQELTDVVKTEVSEDKNVRLCNNHISVEISSTDGTFTLSNTGDTSAISVKGMGRIQNSGDVGDTYHSVPPLHDTVVETPIDVKLVIEEAGPVRGVVCVYRTYDWPQYIDDSTNTRVATTRVEVQSRISLISGEQVVRIKTGLTNTSKDHKTRVVFPLLSPTDHSLSESAFTILKRPITAEGGPSEAPSAVFPTRWFIKAGGLVILTQGLLEYELVNLDYDGNAQELALTLFRATGMLSRISTPLRPLPAGPPIKMEHTQMLGHHEFEYGVCFDEDIYKHTDRITTNNKAREAKNRGGYNPYPYAIAEDTFLPLLTKETTGDGTLPEQGRSLKVDGAIVSALRRTDNGLLELRAFNPTAKQTELTVENANGYCHGWKVDLQSNKLESFEGHVKMKPWSIVTLHLEQL
ncbi:MAG: hypothetical protein M1483_05110 [Actinobacteria bacterium]|nr:hypothetical protein [Actinomycetota bacterium]MCL6104994.1 hypothetical protein [Actinomycetota bacterium]